MEPIQIRILLADDHNTLRDGMRLLLERQPGFAVVGEAADGHEVVQLAQEQSPDVVVMDIAMPNMNGIEATRRIVERIPDIGVVILSMHYDESYVIRSLKAGRSCIFGKERGEDGADCRHFRPWCKGVHTSAPRSAGFCKRILSSCWGAEAQKIATTC
jgi:DNA-binding NarL/FixJ family response regulator